MVDEIKKEEKMLTFEDVEKIKAATEALKKENDRKENMLAMERIGGKTDGARPVDPVKEETSKEYYKRVSGNKI